MGTLPERVRERKIAQWALAYLAAAWVLVEAVDVLGGMFGLSLGVQRAAVVVLAFGFVLTVVVAWYHGEGGRQRVSGTELLIVAGVLVVAGVALRIAVGSEPAADPAASIGPASGSEAGSEASPDPRSVAVLPFADLSADGDQEYLSDGIAEELIGALSGIAGLRVASRTSSFSLKASTLDARQIGRRLEVAHVVEGSVRRSQDRLRVQASLVSVEDGLTLWTERFDSDVADIFAVQDSIALSVASALEIQLRSAAEEIGRRGQTGDHEAQDLYFRGRFAWNRRTREGLEEAVEYFDRAVALDPLYARALVGLGDAWAVLGFYDYRPPDVAFPLAEEAARRALAVDSTLAEPHATLGYAALYHGWDWTAAEHHFLRSIELGPRYPVAHQWYANLLTAMGRFDEAEFEMRRASELDPLSMIAFSALGWVHFYARDYARAIDRTDEAVERDADFELAYLWGGQAREALGDLAGAEERIRTAVDLSDGSAISRTALARVLALRGRTGEARDILTELESESDYVPSYEIARAYVGLDELDHAVDWLERAHRERAHSLAFLRVDPQLDALHDHPGFQALVARMNF